MINRLPVLSIFAICLAQSLLIAAEWQPLFDGKTLEGWTKKGGAATYEVSEGAIVGRSAPNTPNTFLCTQQTFGDFVLTFEYQCDDQLNSGVQFRSQCYDVETTVERDGSKETFAAGRVHGYQSEIDPNQPDRLWSAGIYDEGRRGWLYPGPCGGDGTQFTEVGRKIYKPNEWNSVRIECQGDHIRTWLNGEPRADFRDDATLEGFIALQVHGVGDREDPLTVRWRNIMLQPLENAAPR